MKFVIVGTTQIVVDYADTLLDCGAQIAGMVSLPKTELPLNSANVAEFCSKHEIPYVEFADINCAESVEWIRERNADYILSAWPYILKGEIFNAASGGIIGSHPTELPYNRGRHPLHWSIVLGLSSSMLSFFAMDEGIDTGAILHQEPFEIGDAHISVVVERMSKAATSGLRSLYGKLAEGSMAVAQQEHEKANYWRKRNAHDSLIDPRLSIGAIDRIVRSFSPPYPCATLRVGDHVLSVCSSTQTDFGVDPEDIARMEPGKILDVSTRSLVLKVDDGLVRLVCNDDIPGVVAENKYLFPPSFYMDN